MDPILTFFEQDPRFELNYHRWAGEGFVHESYKIYEKDRPEDPEKSSYIFLQYFLDLEPGNYLMFGYRDKKRMDLPFFLEQLYIYLKELLRQINEGAFELLPDFADTYSEFKRRYLELY